MQNLKIKVTYGLRVYRYLRVNDEKSNKLPEIYNEFSFDVDFGEIDPVTRLTLDEKKVRYLLSGPLLDRVHEIIQEELNKYIELSKREYGIINTTSDRNTFNFRNSDGRIGMLVEHDAAFIKFEYVSGDGTEDIIIKK